MRLPIACSQVVLGTIETAGNCGDTGVTELLVILGDDVDFCLLQNQQRVQKS